MSADPTRDIIGGSCTCLGICEETFGAVAHAALSIVRLALLLGLELTTFPECVNNFNRGLAYVASSISSTLVGL